jgi:RNA polymerase sigma-70 factor, ECF subfamily
VQPESDESSGHRSPPADAPELSAALAGDSEAFRRLTERYLRELHLHCYRMLGSYQDAQDAVQETLLRAWRHLASFAGRSSFRGWLYRVATNVCLTERHRQHPEMVSLPPTIADAVARSTELALHLSPYPDTLLDELQSTSGDPSTEYDAYESVQVAFLGAVQLLPPRQRAVLILRDVVGFSANEVAEMLESTVASVTSALNRARVTLEQQRAAGRLHLGQRAPSDALAQSLAERYAEAWQAADINRLVGLLKSDVVLTMPPLPLRVIGHEAVADFFRAIPLLADDRFRVLPTRANRQPALAAYRLDRDGHAYSAWGIWVLTLESDAIAEITAFIDATLITAFRLPHQLEYPSV